MSLSVANITTMYLVGTPVVLACVLRYIRYLSTRDDCVTNLQISVLAEDSDSEVDTFVWDRRLSRVIERKRVSGQVL